MKLLSRKNAYRIATRAAKAAPRYFAGKLRRPHFIIGSARSGTGILLHALACHRDIAAYPNEANKLWHPQTYPWRTSEHCDEVPPLWADPETFTARSLQLRRAGHARRLRAHFGAFQFFSMSTHFLNKSAMVAFMLPYIREVFPSARFIHIVRDGRAVVLSYLKKQQKKIEGRQSAVYERNGFARSFEELLDVFAGTWRRHIDEIERQKEARLDAENALYELTYEDFCADPRAQLRRVAAFMDLAPERFDDASLPRVQSTNYKYRDELSAEQLEEITETMEPILLQKEYSTRSSSAGPDAAEEST